MKNVKGLIERMRNEFLDDTEGVASGDSKWTDGNLVSALNSAERELARRLFLISDTSTASICRIDIASVEGVFPRSYASSGKIVKIDRLKYPGVTKPLPITTMDVLDQKDPGWDERTGTPSAFILDADNFTITFNRQPVVSGVVSLWVKRLPLNDLSVSNLNAYPEIKQYEDELIHGALKYAYLKDDNRTFDPVRAGIWGKQFNEDISLIIRDKAARTPQEWVCSSEVW